MDNQEDTPDQACEEDSVGNTDSPEGTVIICASYYDAYSADGDSSSSSESWYNNDYRESAYSADAESINDGDRSSSDEDESCSEDDQPTPGQMKAICSTLAQVASTATFAPGQTIEIHAKNDLTGRTSKFSICARPSNLGLAPGQPTTRASILSMRTSQMRMSRTVTGPMSEIPGETAEVTESSFDMQATLTTPESVQRSNRLSSSRQSIHKRISAVKQKNSIKQAAMRVISQTRSVNAATTESDNDMIKIGFTRCSQSRASIASNMGPRRISMRKSQELRKPGTQEITIGAFATPQKSLISIKSKKHSKVSMISQASVAHDAASTHGILNAEAELTPYNYARLSRVSQVSGKKALKTRVGSDADIKEQHSNRILLPSVNLESLLDKKQATAVDGIGGGAVLPAISGLSFTFKTPGHSTQASSAQSSLGNLSESDEIRFEITRIEPKGKGKFKNVGKKVLVGNSFSKKSLASRTSQQSLGTKESMRSVRSNRGRRSRKKKQSISERVSIASYMSIAEDDRESMDSFERHDATVRIHSARKSLILCIAIAAHGVLVGTEILSYNVTQMIDVNEIFKYSAYIAILIFIILSIRYRKDYNIWKPLIDKFNELKGKLLEKLGWLQFNGRPTTNAPKRFIRKGSSVSVSERTVKRSRKKSSRRSRSSKMSTHSRTSYA